MLVAIMSFSIMARFVVNLFYVCLDSAAFYVSVMLSPALRCLTACFVTLFTLTR